MRERSIHQIVLITFLLCQLSICLGSETPDPNASSKYLDAVRTFADNVLKYGRDTYGPKHTPLFVDGLNIHTHEPVKWIDPDGTKWILSNLASQQNLFRTLDGLTRITGDPMYRQAAQSGMQVHDVAVANIGMPSVCRQGDDDPYGDILVGAARYRGDWSGRAYLFYSNTKTLMDTTCDYILAGHSRKNNYFGWSLSAGDANADGHIDALISEEGVGRACLFYGPFHDTTDITFNWDTTNANPGKHTLKASIAPVAREADDVADNNSMTVEVEVKERPESVSMK